MRSRCPQCASDLPRRASRCPACGHVISRRLRRTLQSIETQSFEPPPPPLAGRYQLLERIGEGGVGEVWRGVDLERGEAPVAVKRLRPELARDLEARAALLSEHALVRTLDHPRIVAVHAAEETDSEAFIVMELIRGPSLAAVLERRDRLSGREARLVGMQVCEALMHAHAGGVAHLDLKPSNLLLASPRDAKARLRRSTLDVRLSDFGIAQTADQRGHGGRLWGTPAHMAPEQREGRFVDERADIYAMGCVLFELVTGAAPDAHDTLALDALPRGARPLRPVIERCMAFDPEDRYRSAAKLREALHAVRFPTAAPAVVTASLLIGCAGVILWNETPTRESAIAETVASNETVTLGDIGENLVKPTPFDEMVPLGPPAFPIETASPAIALEPDVQPPSMASPTEAPPIIAMEEIPTSEQPSAPPAPLPAPPEALINSLGMRMRLVEGGRFAMGSAAAEPGRASDEGPLHFVEIDPLRMSELEVTVAQYARFLNATGHRPPPRWDEQCGQPLRPVVHVTWHDAQAFCRWLSDRDGIPYALPTEAQWEFACRGGNGFGLSLRPRVVNARFDEPPPARLREAGSHVPNALGLHDMQGNVWEWCHDAYSPRFYDTVEDGERNPVNRAAIAQRTVRGGSWLAPPTASRPAERQSHLATSGAPDLGFRVACAVE